MKYCLDIYLETENPGLQTAALAVVDSILSEKVWAPVLRAYTRRIVLGGDKKDCVDISVRYNTLADAIAAYDSARGLLGIFVACRNTFPGSSYVRIHECDWDNPAEGCKVMDDYNEVST